MKRLPNERRKAPRGAVFHPEFREDLRSWIETDRKVALRALDLVEAILRDPFHGIGKPSHSNTCPPAPHY